MDKLKILENENQIKEHNKKYDLIILTNKIIITK